MLCSISLDSNNIETKESEASVVVCFGLAFYFFMSRSISSNSLPMLRFR